HHLLTWRPRPILGRGARKRLRCSPAPRRRVRSGRAPARSCVLHVSLRRWIARCSLARFSPGEAPDLTSVARVEHPVRFVDHEKLDAGTGSCPIQNAALVGLMRGSQHAALHKLMSCNKAHIGEHKITAPAKDFTRRGAPPIPIA